MKKKQVKISDVAEEAGVSPTTVSRVINKVTSVKAENRIRVEEAIKRLNYRPNIAAQRLAGGKNNTIGLVIPRFDNIFNSFFVSEIIKGVGEMADVVNLDILLHVYNEEENHRVLGKEGFINTSYLAGILFADIYGNREQVKSVVKEGVPCIVINNLLEDIKVNCIGVDNRKAAYEATKYLISLGHKRIAIICGDMNSQSGQQRLKGYKKALKDSGILFRDEYIVPGDYKRDVARVSMERLLKLEEPPTGVFAASDEMAIEGIEVILESGMNVPGDISIVGFDNSPICQYSPVPLTTIDQPLFDMGKRAVELLKNAMLLKRNVYKKIVLPTRLVERKSCSSIC